MQLLSKMNAKMDQGYKMTNFFCQFCKGVTLTKPEGNSEGYVYCPKCNKEYIPEFDNNDEIEEKKSVPVARNVQIPQIKNNNQTAAKNINKNMPNDEHEIDEVENQYQQFLKSYNSLSQNSYFAKSQETSKKIGQKLISGWSMTEDSCPDCCVPLMRSAKGNILCCGCDRDFSLKKQQNKNNASSLTPAPAISPKPNMQKTKIQQSKNIPEKSEGNNTDQRAKIDKLIGKSLDFLQTKLEQAISINDLDLVEKVLKNLKTVKELSFC